jgi:hypothetical protein
MMRSLRPARLASTRPPLRSFKLALAWGAILVLAGSLLAQTLVDLGATAPVPGTDDISQLSTTSPRRVTRPRPLPRPGGPLPPRQILKTASQVVLVSPTKA